MGYSSHAQHSYMEFTELAKPTILMGKTIAIVSSFHYMYEINSCYSYGEASVIQL